MREEERAMREGERRKVRWRGDTGAAGKARRRGDKRRKGKKRNRGKARERGTMPRGAGNNAARKREESRAEEGGKPRGARIKKAPNARSFFVFVFGLFRPVVST